MKLKLHAIICLLLIAATACQATASDSPPTKSFIYKKTKQADLKIVLHYPHAWKETDKRPAIVFFFGGGWTSGTIKQFEPQAEHLAGLGMVAARADYRVKSRQGVSPKECVEDAKSAVRWLRQNAASLGIDPDRIVAAGGSAGGHLAACTALTPGVETDGEDIKVSSKPNALVLFNPVLRFSGVPEMARRLGNDEVLAKALSPTLHLEKTSPPAILFFGTADKLKAQGDEFMKKSKDLGHRGELFTAEGQGHGFFNRPPWQERTTKRMDEFLASLGYIDGKAAEKASVESAMFDIKSDKPDDHFTVKIEKDAARVYVVSKGIGGLQLTNAKGKWPSTVVIRIQVSGLEHLGIGDGKTRLTGSMSGHGDGDPGLAEVTEDGKEKKIAKDSPYWTEIKGFDAGGNSVSAYAGKGGYYEFKVPRAFLEGQTKSLYVGWIDFYRS
jgi:acetyl esterase/lipase